MTYVAVPTDGTRPLDSDDASGGAAELRALKAYLQTLVTGGSTPFNGYAWQGFRNKLINGNFDIWQRGTSLAAGTGNRYLADRWFTDSLGTTNNPSRQSFPLGGTAPAQFEPSFYHRTIVASVAGAGNFSLQSQRIESVRTFAGQTAILSFVARADAIKNIAIEFAQNFGTGGAPSASVTAIGVVTKSLTTTFALYTAVVTFPSLSGKTLGTDGNDHIQVNFWFDAGTNFNARTNSLGQQSGTFDIAQVQFEPGGSVTPFELLPPEVTESLCRRFAVVFTTNNVNNGLLAYGGAEAGATGTYGFFFTPALRSVPAFTNLQPVGNYILTNGAGASVGAVTSFSLSNQTAQSAKLAATVAGGLTAGQVSNLLGNGMNATGLLFTSEL